MSVFVVVVFAVFVGPKMGGCGGFSPPQSTFNLVAGDQSYSCFQSILLPLCQGVVLMVWLRSLQGDRVKKLGWAFNQKKPARTNRPVVLTFCYTGVY